MEIQKYITNPQNKILSVFVFDAVTVCDKPQLILYFWGEYQSFEDITVAEDKFVDEMAYALVTIARQVYQQEVDRKINNGGIIPK